MSKTHNLFISHSWAYDHQYDGLLKLLNSRSYFFYNNYSIPIDDPIHTNGTDKQLYEAIYNKISPCGVIVIPKGLFISI